jgi:hypothetical protein
MNNSELIKILKEKEQDLIEEKNLSQCALEVCKSDEDEAYNYLLLAEKTLTKYPSEKAEEVYWKRYETWNEAQELTQAAEEIYDSFCQSLEAVKNARRALETLENMGL